VIIGVAVGAAVELGNGSRVGKASETIG